MGAYTPASLGDGLAGEALETEVSGVLGGDGKFKRLLASVGWLA